MVRMGVIGVGYFGRLHALKFAEMPDVDLVGVVDSDFSRAEEVGEECDCTAWAGWDDMLKYTRPDAVSIATPLQYHYPLGWLMLKRGLDVFIEKPMAARVEEADHLIAVAKRKDRVLQVGHIERFNPVVRGLRHDNLKITRLSPYSQRVKDVDVVMDLMIHDIDLVLCMFGKTIYDIKAHGKRVVSDHIDTAWAMIEFDNGITVELTADRAGHVVERWVQVGLDRAVNMHYQGDPLRAELNAFVSSIHTRTAPVVTGEDGRDALRIVHRIINLIEGDGND